MDGGAGSAILINPSGVSSMRRKSSTGEGGKGTRHCFNISRDRLRFIVKLTPDPSVFLKGLKRVHAGHQTTRGFALKGQ